MRSLFRTTALLLVYCSLLVAPASAQFETRWLSVGELHHNYYGGGGEYEGLIRFDGWSSPPLLTERPATTRASGLWIGAQNVRGEDGTTYPFRVVHVGPRVSGNPDFTPVEFKQVSRFEPPVVTVDGFDTFLRYSFNDEVDPNLEADRAVVAHNRSLLGLDVERTAMQFSNEYHDNYHITEYVFTNTGNTDGDDEVELPGQTLDGVYFTFLRRRDIWIQHRLVLGGWSVDMVYDVVGDQEEDYGVDLRAMYSWQAHHVQQSEPDPLGVPIANRIETRFLPQGDTMRLAVPQFVGTATLHADRSATDDADAPDQPSAYGWSSADLDIMRGNDPFNVALMTEEYAFMSQPNMYPHHADVVYPGSDFEVPPPQRPDLNLRGGPQGFFSYGPYTIPPGESVRIVQVEGVDGLSLPAASAIGRAFRASGFDNSVSYAYDADGDGAIGADEELTKNAWVLTGRDSLFQTFERATANYESGYGAPHAPLPPSRFAVSSGVDRIVLEWDTYAAASPSGFEIYRTQEQFAGDPLEAFAYDLIASVGPGERRYEDAAVTRGIGYYYYIQAVGDVNANGTGETPTGVRLKSNRYYTQTYDPAILTRQPGSSLEAARVVPNPYNLASDRAVRWPGQDNRLGFLNVPGRCTIRIFTQLGELVETIEHTDGSGDAYWNLHTSANQIVVSGIYFAAIEDLETGEQVIRKFSVIR